VEKLMTIVETARHLLIAGVLDVHRNIVAFAVVYLRTNPIPG
jgi:hypothetical protein